MKSISILGSGWLGFPLAQHFINAGYTIKASTTSENRKALLTRIGAAPFIVDINSLTQEVQDFLQSNILICNIPSKNIPGFRCLIDEIEVSKIENVLFISSTSVYRGTNMVITESEATYVSESPLLEIENLFKGLRGVKTTIVRFGGLIGYSRHPGRFFKPGRVIQNPDEGVNLIHRDDCIGIISEIIQQQCWGEVFNGCADTHPTKREFYSRAVELAGGSRPAFDESNSGPVKIISNRKAKELLNYEFKHPDLMKIEFDKSP